VSRGTIRVNIHRSIPTGMQPNIRHRIITGIIPVPGISLSRPTLVPLSYQDVCRRLSSSKTWPVNRSFRFGEIKSRTLFLRKSRMRMVCPLGSLGFEILVCRTREGRQSVRGAPRL
jgi:hypothetical protein